MKRTRLHRNREEPKSREERVEALITNECFKDNQEDWLLSLDDAVFDQIETNALKANQADELITTNEQLEDKVKTLLGKDGSGSDAGSGGDNAGGPSVDTDEDDKNDDDVDEAEGTDMEDEDSARLEKNKKGGGNKANRQKNNQRKAPVMTVEDFITNAPGPMKDILGEAFELHEEQRLNHINALKANEACEFSEDELSGMSLKQLSKLVALAGSDTDYSGQEGDAMHANEDDGGEAPEMPTYKTLQEESAKAKKK